MAVAPEIPLYDRELPSDFEDSDNEMDAMCKKVRQYLQKRKKELFNTKDDPPEEWEKESEEEVKIEKPILDQDGVPSLEFLEKHGVE